MRTVSYEEPALAPIFGQDSNWPHQRYMASIIRTSQKKDSRHRMLFLASKNEYCLPMLLSSCPVHQNQLPPGSCFRAAETSKIQEADNV
jgi:hypothetical protein